MDNHEKTMQLANFNITFGIEDVPMLEHFLDVIYPALKSDYLRGREGEKPRFYFSDIQLKIVHDEYILAGNYIKDTEYDILTTVENGELHSNPAIVPTAPYSRFLVFLKNHRMVLVKNESYSPDIRSFQATMRLLLADYIGKVNKRVKNKFQKLPNAVVNIVDIPLLMDIAEALKEVKRIESLNIRFFPLNNDLDQSQFLATFRETMGKVDSKHAHAEFRSPGSKQEVAQVISDSAGLAATTLEVVDSQGAKKKIREDQYSSKVVINLDQDVSPKHDRIIVKHALKNESICTLSKSNKKLFEKMKPKLDEYISFVADK